jgi:hypothetical protein
MPEEVHKATAKDLTLRKFTSCLEAISRAGLSKPVVCSRITMKQYSEQVMKDTDPDRVRPGWLRILHSKFVLRWLLVAFCIAVWAAFAIFLIW